MRSLALLLLVCVIAGCGSSARGTPTASSPASAISAVPRHHPPPVALTPPPTAGHRPEPALSSVAGPDSFLYGNDGLIVTLPNDGTFHPSDLQRGLAGGIKLGWWRIAHGDLVIATARLDGPAVPLAADVPSGYGDTGFQVSGLNFPAPGCWQVSGTVGGTTLTFVVNVAAR